MNRLNTSEGTPKPATWPMWRGPLAYGQATADRTWVMRVILGVALQRSVAGFGPRSYGGRVETLIAEDLALLLLDDDKGTMAASSAARPLFGGALLVELALAGA